MQVQLILQLMFGSHSLIKKLDVKLNGRDVDDCNNANHVVNIKNLLGYSAIFSK